MILDLNDGWRLLHEERGIDVPFQIPGDVHSALLDSGHIENPYYRDNEYAVDWVHQQQWTLEREFKVTEDDLTRQCLIMLDQVDCLSTIHVNDSLIGSTESQFLRYSFDVTTHLEVGINRIRIRFDSPSLSARRKAEQFPFELPYLSWNCRVPHNNMLRKTPCHAGWDWNLCLMPVGIYGHVRLQCVSAHWIEDVRFEQQFDGDDVVLQVCATVHSNEHATVPCSLNVAGAELNSVEALTCGSQELHWSLSIPSPQRWWPVGSGEQTRHDFALAIGDKTVNRKIGFREVRIQQAPDEDGSGFSFIVNGQAIFMRGANWIPADALPQRITRETVEPLLRSAVDAHMNMLRVWGGGQYEPDWFYELCDELGILIWQDFMFSCNHYPAADPHWLALVEQEARQQVRRLSSHPCVAVWCGDNELVGALNWWDITRDHRDRYLANYSRLNHTLERTTQDEIDDVAFWPSSPSVGHMNFGDGWKNDAAGDMHFWDVWHEAKPFSAYQDIHPRFCSEFGFQSFPSMPVIDTFAEASDKNVSSAVMAVHQRNVGGNARIVETLVRHFEFPNSFERMVFLSQCQQAMAIKTAVEYWRCLKPHCTGTLFWQLNDTWPVASWSSLEYGGGWKLLHYAARRFYQPVLVAMVPGHERFNTHGQLQLKAVNDTSASIELDITTTAHDIQGTVLSTRTYTTVVNPDAACLVDVIDTDVRTSGEIHAGAKRNESIAYYRVIWTGATAAISGVNEYWMDDYKAFALPTPLIQVAHTQIDGEEHVELTTDTPAYWVTLDLGGRRIFSDNGFTLLPEEVCRIKVERSLTTTNTQTPDALSSIRVQHL